MPQPHLVAPASTVGPAAQKPLTLSKRQWDLDWERILPWSFEEVAVESGTFDEAIAFIAQHYAQIFGTEEVAARFLVEPMSRAKRNFGAEMDVFLFRVEGRTVGIVMSHPSDWSTYYMRTAAVLPEYRGRQLVSRFLERICEPLRDAGVVRLEGDVSQANSTRFTRDLREAAEAAPSSRRSARRGSTTLSRFDAGIEHRAEPFEARPDLRL